jgi:hypothetical protein
MRAPSQCKPISRPGRVSSNCGSFKSRMQGLANEVLPESFKAKQVAKTSEPGSGKH